MRLSQNRFEFFGDRVMEPTAEYQINDTVTDRGTTLRYVRTERKVYIDGEVYQLEAMQANILLALMNDYDHSMEGAVLREACGSTASSFRPVKQFDRNKLVYETFIQYLPGDKEYKLMIPTQDMVWLCGRGRMAH